MSPASPSMPDVPSLLHRFEGALLGLALGDALGAPHEGGPVERMVWRVLGKTPEGLLRYTDDTQMSLDLAESLLACQRLHPDDVARRFASSYRFDRGYGPGSARVLKQIRAGQPWSQARFTAYPDGSSGNGGAMRAPVIGLVCHSQPHLLGPMAEQSAAITHAHPLGIAGAQLIAHATAAALVQTGRRQLMAMMIQSTTTPELKSRLQIGLGWLASREAPSAKLVRAELGMGITAATSCPTAVYLACRFQRQPFTELLDFAAQAGGDVDTVCAMAGAIWGAWRGVDALPANALAQLEDAQRIRALAAPLLMLSQAHKDPLAAASAPINSPGQRPNSAT